MKKILISICFVGLLVGMTHCSKADSDGETIILLGTEGYVAPLMGIIPDTLQTPFPEHFGDIPEGYIPPNIEGEYCIEKRLFYSNLIPLHDDSDMHIRITDQHNRVATVEFHDYSIARTDTAYVVGSGSLFTLYFTEDREMDFYGFRYTNERTIVISGEKASDGIRNLRLGIIIMAAKKSNTPYVSGFVPGMYFLYEDLDGVSENCEWFDEHNAEDNE